MHINQVLAAQRLSNITKSLGRGLLLLLFLALQGVKTHRLIGTERINVSTRIHEARMRDGGAVVDDLVQRVVLLGLGCVEDVDEPVCAGRE
jgi:hypothetical protein